MPFVLWASLWAHPRTLPHAASYLVVRHLYRHADAIVTYGPHVSAYVRAKGAEQPVFEAPQSVDNAYWNGQSTPIRRAPFQAAFVGRIAGEKGPQVLIQAWSLSGLTALSAALVLVGGGPIRARAVATGAVLPEGPQPPAEVRNFYAGSDVVVVPSVATRDFREPWGLVVNEAFNQGVPVIATDAVGAVAGGLVRHERTGLVVPAGDAGALAAALRRMHDEPELRARLGAAGREAVKAYTHDAWAAGVSKRAGQRGSKPLLAWKAMVRLLTLSGLILLLAAPTASAGVREKILRECQDGRITGDYTPGQLRDARKHIPTDIDEYSDCRDVLARAALSSGGGLGRRRRRRRLGGAAAASLPGGGATTCSTPPTSEEQAELDKALGDAPQAR